MIMKFEKAYKIVCYGAYKKTYDSFMHLYISLASFLFETQSRAYS
jgi:hypothetical protein